MRFLKRFLYISASVVFIGVAALWFAVRASLPQLDGARALAGLTAAVQVSRDQTGVVTIHAGDRRDAALATGFVHAQERFFQMDLMRRLAAGELAALVGEAAAELDAQHRVHRLRSVARRVVKSMDSSQRAIVHAYTVGVNAGVQGLSVRPFEYLILRESPSTWRAEDTVLSVLAMYLRLHDERATGESRLGRLHDALPPAMYAFLTQAGTPWDAPLVGAAMASLAVPGADVCDLRQAAHGALARDARRLVAGFGETIPVGSNAWAVSGRRTRDGVAMLANDMHLGLSIPNTWFRLRLQVDAGEPSGPAVDVTGVTLPGTPVVVAGSNGHVAWGLTNTYGDWVDLVVLEMDPRDGRRYRTVDGYREFQEHREVIQIHGSAPRTQVVKNTIWGPVIDSDGSGRLRALRWLAHDWQATNMGLLGMERARTVEQAMQVAHASGLPPQNVLLADSGGNIAWTVMGRIPRRRGYDPMLPTSWANGDSGWFGWLSSHEYPVIMNPASGALWSANNRAVDGAALVAIGDGGYALGARARQIRDSLLELDGAVEADMLAIQLDDRALFLAPWRRLLLQVLSPGAVAGHQRRADFRRVLLAGARRAAVDDAGYRLVRAFRRALAGRVFADILMACGGLDAKDFPPGLRQWEGALWRILDQRPMHMLNPGYQSWHELLLATADGVARQCGEGELEDCTWGDANVLRLRHPLSRALPLVAPWLDMPARPLPGDIHMPRVQGPAMGASERFAVAPGRESSGYFQMPGGQSGHPMSPFYDAGHRAWAEGQPTPFLPGPSRHRLTLSAASD
jgi:penicillin amidase